MFCSMRRGIRIIIIKEIFFDDADLGLCLMFS